MMLNFKGGKIIWMFLEGSRGSNGSDLDVAESGGSIPPLVLNFRGNTGVGVAWTAKTTGLSDITANRILGVKPEHVDIVVIPE